jgi:4-phospho-D-threonate 3-dehydrogenase / 4-phospho-D-erythronate 3-dehydrogenase
MKPRIAITVGDFNGIGPEVVLRSIRSRRIAGIAEPVLVGPADVFQFYAGLLGMRLSLVPFDTRRTSPGEIRMLESSTVLASRIRPGTLDREAGSSAASAITAAVALAVRGDADAIVTAPVSKQALHLAGVSFPGQTEMVQQLSHSPRVAMMLVSSSLRVGLVTIHIPLARVARALTSELIAERIRVIHHALRQDWRIRRPVVAVLGLNPHAGEGGDIGTEEQNMLIPVLQRLRRTGLQLEGPFPADGFFARYRQGLYDAVVAMYHDQGLIPLKMSSAGRAVNVSVGLRIVRTSPDHGTAFDIAGRGVADNASMIEAILLAVRMAHNRRLPRTRP